MILTVVPSNLWSYYLCIDITISANLVRKILKVEPELQTPRPKSIYRCYLDTCYFSDGAFHVASEFCSGAKNKQLSGIN